MSLEALRTGSGLELEATLSVLFNHLQPAVNVGLPGKGFAMHASVAWWCLHTQEQPASHFASKLCLLVYRAACTLFLAGCGCP